jgi:formylglycine-generating enzyme required for sulfatase activity
MIVLVALALHLPAAASEEEEVLTNDTVLEMIKMGLHGDVIIAKMRASKCDFDTSSETLMQLMRKGVNTEILKAMINENAHPSKLCDEPASGKAAASAMDEVQTVVNKKDLVYVRGGCFRMGDIFNAGGPEEKPVHEVCVDDFYIGRHEVTVGEFREFMEDEEYEKEEVPDKNCFYHNGDRWIKDADKKWKSVGYPQGKDHPVTCVSWSDAMAYIRWRSLKDGIMYRLPTEAEWEYAARSGGKQHLYDWGYGEPSGNIADESVQEKFPGWFIWESYNDGYTYTAPVGSFKSNEIGLHDMTGNVWEWVTDWYAPDYYANSPVENPKGPDSGRSKILRGGSWFDIPTNLRTTFRSWNRPGLRNFYNGFRLAATEN